MGTPIDLPILFSNIPAVAKMTNADFTHAGTQQAMLGPRMAEQMEQLRSTVQEVEKSDDVEAVDEESHQEQQASERRRRRDKQEEPEEETPTTASNASPWTGNILNLKI
jgi:hypothetical protein